MAKDEEQELPIMPYSYAAAHTILGDLFIHLHNGIMITDNRMRIVDVNPAFTTITEYEKEEVLGKTPDILSSGFHKKDFYNALWATIENQGYWQGELWNRKKSGATFPELLTIHKIFVEADKRTYYVGVFADISSLAKGRLRTAFYDSLTKVANRELMTEHLLRDIARVKRHNFDTNENRLIGILFIDLNRFKQINDTYGHVIGDEYLIEVASRLRDCARKTDTVCRFGGDEFVILYPMIREREDMTIICHRILDAFTRPFVVEGHILNLVCSMGVSLYPDDAENGDDLLRCADTAMYIAKKSKKDNNFRFHDDLES